jgi:Tol biopolymer transport system component
VPQLSGQLAVPICTQPCSERNDRQVILINFNGSAGVSTRLMARAATDPSFQADGRRVVFRSLAVSQEGRGEGVFISDLPSNTEIRVDGGTDDYWPVFIEQGWVLFSSTRVEENQKKQFRLFIATRYNSEDAPQGVGPDPIVVLKDARFSSYSPSGLIAYSGCVGGGCGIWSTTVRGYAPRDACCQVARGASDTAPDWSPDGTRLAFTSREEGNFEIYVVNANGTGRTRLTRSGGTNVAPTWSPDGQWIAYLSDRGGSWAVWLIRPDQPAEIVKLFDINGTVDDAPNRRMDWGERP